MAGTYREGEMYHGPFLRGIANVFSIARLRLGTRVGAVADGFFGEESLLADAVRDFGEFTLVGTDGREVVGLADEIEGAESFPDLFVTGVDGGDFGASGYLRARDHEEGADAAADGRANLDGSLAILRYDC